MSDIDTLYCENHPGRIALERCEVCGKPLCAYCLYYTEDGQRLCAQHAEHARKQGLHVDEPGTYADQLIGAQAGADRKQKRGESSVDRTLYRGNSTDLSSLLAMILGITGLGMCCGVAYCMPVFAFGLSIMALLNAHKAHDKARTRRLGWIGLLTSGVLVLGLVACIAMYVLSFAPFFTVLNASVNTVYTPPAPVPVLTVTPNPALSPTPTLPESRSQLRSQLDPAPADADPALAHRPVD